MKNVSFFFGQKIMRAKIPVFSTQPHAHEATLLWLLFMTAKSTEGKEEKGKGDKKYHSGAMSFRHG
jgi:hypothetical protein